MAQQILLGVQIATFSAKSNSARLFHHSPFHRYLLPTTYRNSCIISILTFALSLRTRTYQQIIFKMADGDGITTLNLEVFVVQHIVLAMSFQPTHWSYVHFPQF